MASQSTKAEKPSPSTPQSKTPETDLLLNHDDAHPLVTVIVVTHPGQHKYLRRCLNSIAAQTLPHDQIQVLVMHDGPDTGDCDEIIGECLDGHDFNEIDFIAEQQRYGYYPVLRNKGTILARGLYIANLDGDNEWTPEHLSGLVAAIRRADSRAGWPHFVYSRREYVRDPGTPENLPEGPSPLVEWVPENVGRLTQTPKNNFIDSSDFLIGKGTLYYVADKTGCMWNHNVRRFADWELATRFVGAGLRGLAVDQVTHRYHWNPDSVQVQSMKKGMTAIPVKMYEELRKHGQIRD